MEDRMKKAMWLVPAVFALAAVGAQPVEAQVVFGPQVTWADDADLGIGGRVGFGVPAGEGVFARLQIFGAFDYFLDGFGGCSECSYFEITPFARVPVAISEGLDTYVGAGLNIARFSFEEDLVGFDYADTETGLAAIGGIEFPISSLAAFGEIRLTLGGAEQLVLDFGFLFGGGGS